MVINNYGVMDRQSADTEALTRLLVNGRIKGRGTQIVKLPGYENYITTLDISGGGTITLGTNAVFFKDPNHSYATDPTVIVAYNDKLYYWDSGNSYWVEITWNDNLNSADFTPLSDVRFWFERGILHVASGVNGVPSIYRYIKRQGDNTDEGWFLDKDSGESAVTFDSFWLGSEEMPDFDGDNIVVTPIEALGQVDDYNDALATEREHYLLGVYACAGGQQAIPKVDGVKRFVCDDQTHASFVADMAITLATGYLDKRVIGIDLYGAKFSGELISGKTPVIKVEGMKPNISFKEWSFVSEGGESEFHSIEWRLLKRLDINQPNVIWSGTAYAESGSSNYLRIVFSTVWSSGFFPKGCLDDTYYIRYRATPDSDWTYDLIDEQTVQTSSAPYYTRLKLTTGGLTPGDIYFIQIVSPWVSGGGGTIYTIHHLWRFEGEGDSETELGDPITETQPYGLTEEYFPLYNFAAVQNRRVGRLGVKTNIEHKNLFLWGEEDKPSVTPNRNNLLLHTLPGENPKGIATVRNGWLALFERTCHYILMTGEPVQYDAEEGRFEEGCIASKSVVNIDEVVYWLGTDGVKAFDGSGEPVDLTKDVLKDDYMDLIASEYSGNSSSYEGISGGYCANEKLIVWAFPNASNTIGGVAVNGLAYDLHYQCFYFLLWDKDFTHLFSDYSGNLYGVTSTGIYKLFGSSPSESNQMIWESGQVMAEINDQMVETARIRYKGQITAKIYNDDQTDPTLNDDLGSNASLDNVVRKVHVKGENWKVKVESTSDTNDCEVGRIELRTRGIKR